MQYIAAVDSLPEIAQWICWIMLIPSLIASLIPAGFLLKNRSPALARLLLFAIPPLSLAWFDFISGGYYRQLLGYSVFLLVSWLILGFCYRKYRKA